MLLLLSLSLTRQAAAQGEASRYVIVPNNAAVIDPAKDYFSVSLETGWISTRHNALQRLLSTTSKFSVLIESTVTFFDGQKIEASETFSNKDVRPNVSKAWGVNPLLYSSLPGDANPALNIQLAIYREDNIGRVLESLDNSKAALPSDIVTSPVIGYARAVSGVFRSLFGTDRTRYPFLWQGSLRSSAATTSTGLKEHYVVLVAPRDPNDKTYAELDPSKLSYDSASQRLKYNSNVVTDWSYAVLHVRKAQPYNVAQLAYSSNAPWATLASSFFGALPVSDASNADELGALARTVRTQLVNQRDLLKRELRFSAFSRAVALASFATDASEQIQGACTRLSIAKANCPVTELDREAQRASAAFGLTAPAKSEVLTEAVRTAESLQTRSSANSQD
jgi:hypothetical protein